MKNFFFFIGVSICFSLLGSSEVFAVNIDKTQPNNECRAVFTQAITEAELTYDKNLNAFLENQKSSMTAKTKGENLTSYDETFSCHLKSICAAVRSGSSEESIFNERRDGCKNRTVADVEKEMNVSFAVCREDKRLEIRRQDLSICEDFIQQKIRSSRREVGQKVRKISSLENQGILGAKILSIMKRMDVLLEKTRKFAVDFNMVINDISCTVPNESIPQ